MRTRMIALAALAASALLIGGTSVANATQDEPADAPTAVCVGFRRGG
ncbi:hypothetical protein [Pseudonocardia sp. NPDC049635]